MAIRRVEPQLKLAVPLRALPVRSSTWFLNSRVHLPERCSRTVAVGDNFANFVDSDLRQA